MKIEIDQDAMDTAAAEESVAFLQAQVQYLSQRVIHLNAANRALVARVAELEPEETEQS